MARTKWEYYFFEPSLGTSWSALQQQFNKHGQDGWELVAAYPGNYPVYVLKRPLSPVS